jgi:hypothetical protein
LLSKGLGAGNSVGMPCKICCLNSSLVIFNGF